MNIFAPRRGWCLAASCALLLTLPVGAAAGPRSKLDLHLQRTVKGDSGTYRVIIRAKPGHRGALKHDVQQSGHKVHGEYPGIEAVSTEVSAATLRALARNPNVASISTDADLDGLDSDHSNKSKASKSSPSSQPSPSTT